MTSGTPGTSTVDLLNSLSADLTALVRQEFQRVQQELVGKVRQAGAGAGMLGATGLLGGLAAGTSVTLVRRILDERLPPVTSALLTAVSSAQAPQPSGPGLWSSCDDPSEGPPQARHTAH